MTKRLTVFFLAGLVIMFPFMSRAFYDEVGNSYAFKNVTDLNLTTDMKHSLEKSVGLIGEKGKAAFSEIKKMNQNSSIEIFVVDPVYGKILIAPELDLKKNEPIVREEVNTKVIAEIVRKNSFHRPGSKSAFSVFDNRDYDLFLDGFAARTVVSPKWKVYVVLA